MTPGTSCPEVPNHKHQITNKFQEAKSQGPNKDQEDKQQTCLPAGRSQTRSGNQGQSKSPNKTRLFPGLGFAVLLFGPCLGFGTCYLELTCHLMRERGFFPCQN
jgi:hypothetical protein